MSTMPALCFGPYRLSGPHGPLWCKGEELALRPKALEMLWYLAGHAGEVVEHDRLFDALWPRTVVSEGTLAVTIGELRRALGDDARQPRYIRTVHRHGYRFIAPIEALAPPETVPAPAAAAELLELPGRTVELERLQSAYEQACRGRRRVVFVSGEAGIGKSTLVETWLGRLAPGEDIWLGRGQCVEHYAGGEPYLALLEALSRLCRGPGGEAVIEQLRRRAPGWLAQLPGVVEAAEREALRGGAESGTAQHYQRELADVLEALGAEHTVVLVLEDLHWSNHLTVEALAVLVRRPEAARLLVIGTYRPVELIMQAHPLKTLKQELQTHGLCQELALGGLDETAVRIYVSRHMPPETAETAAAMVYRRTAGQPLFMVNLTEYLAQHPELTMAGTDNGPTTATVPLPDSLRQFIEAEFERLSEAEQRVLEAASVAGVMFSSATVAAALALPEIEVETVCEELARRGQFIVESGLIEWTDGTVSERYDFRHALYNEVLYRRMAASRRVRLHRAIGEQLEAGHGAEGMAIAVELAEHFEQGRDFRRAVRYRRLAGESALGRYASREALAHLQGGLALLTHWPDGTERVQEELHLRTSLGVVQIAIEGFGAPSVARTYRRAHALCRQLAHHPALLPVLCGLWNYFLARSELRRARMLARELAAYIEQPPAREYLLPAHNVTGQTHLFVGEPILAQRHIDAELHAYDLETHRHLATRYGEDPAVVCHMYAAVVHWLLGRPEQALRRIDAGLRLAHKLAQPFSVVQMLWAGMLVTRGCGNPIDVESLARDLIERCQQENNTYWLGGGRILLGWALARQGQSATGIDAIRQGLKDWEATGTVLIRPYYLALLAEAYGECGRVSDGLEALAAALVLVQRTGERWYEAELYRLQGELRLQQGASEIGEIETLMQHALTIARRQQALALELRAATSLARLWADRGRRREARELLAPVFDGFTEGFATADLRDARALLDELSRGAVSRVAARRPGAS